MVIGIEILPEFADKVIMRLKTSRQVIHELHAEPLKAESQ
jgi:hypothetical protein